MDRNKVDDRSSRIGAGESAGRARHCGSAVEVIKEIFDLHPSALGVEIGVRNETGRAAFDERSCVRRLMVAGGAGTRHEDRWHSSNGQFCHRRCASPTQHHVGCRVNRRHVIFVLDKVVLQRKRAVIGGTGHKFGMVATPADMADGERRPVTYRGNGIGDRVVDPAGTERPTKHGNERPVSIDTEPFARVGSIGSGCVGDSKNLTTNRVAGPNRAGQVCAFKRHCARLREPTCHPIRSARYGVLLSDDDRHSPQHGAKYTRHRGVTPKSNDNSGPRPTNQDNALDDRRDKPEDRSDVRERQLALDTPARQHREWKACVGDETGLDATRTTPRPNRLGRHASGYEFLRNSETGDNVARSAATRDDRKG